MMQAISLREKAAACRRLARLARQSDIARPLLELAEDFEQVAFDCGAKAQAQPAPIPKSGN